MAGPKSDVIKIDPVLRRVIRENSTTVSTDKETLERIVEGDFLIPVDLILESDDYEEILHKKIQKRATKVLNRMY